MKINWRLKVLIGIVMVCITIGLIWRHIRNYSTPQVIIQKEFQKAPEIKEVKSIEKIGIPMKSKTIKVIDKQEIVKKIKGIPIRVLDDSNKGITAITITPSYKGKTSVIAVTDVATGEAELFTKQEPLSFISSQSKIQIGLSYYPIHSKEIGDCAIDTSYEFGRIWKIHGMVRGEIDSKTNWKTGIRGYIEW